MRRGVSAQDRVFVDVIRVGLTSAWVILRESKGIEVLVNRYNWGKFVVGFVCGTGESALNESARD